MSLPTSGPINTTDIRNNLNDDVVHNTLDESISGLKTFTDNTQFDSNLNVDGLLSKNNKDLVRFIKINNDSDYNNSINTTYLKLPLDTIIVFTNSADKFIEISGTDLQLKENGKYIITYDFTFKSDSSKINNILFSYDQTEINKKLMTNISNFLYNCSFSLYCDVTSAPKILNMYVKTDINTINLTIEKLTIDIIKIN
jgi:hypothetical protein